MTRNQVAIGSKESVTRSEWRVKTAGRRQCAAAKRRRGSRNAEEKQQAENGREAAKLYARWEHLDDQERERLLQLAEGGKNSPAFAEQLMTNLSYRGRDQQEAVLLLAGSLETGGRDGQPSAADARLYKALSGSLATATGPDSSIGSPGGVTSAWTDKLISTARDGNGLPTRHPGAIGGGAATLKDLTDLMAADAGDKAYDPNDKNASPYDKDKGDPVYSEAFLHEVSDTIREWETDNDDAYDGVMRRRDIRDPELRARVHAHEHGQHASDVHQILGTWTGRPTSTTSRSSAAISPASCAASPRTPRRSVSCTTRRAW